MNLNVEKRFLALEILLLGVLILISPQLYGEDTGFKYFKNYSYWDYDHQPQNWAVTQDRHGIIYVGNNGGLLEFDGVSWRLIETPNYSPVRSLAMDETGTLYIGGSGQIGYLARDARGFCQYVSLLNYLEVSDRDFSNVVSTHATKDGIYFCTSNFLFRWNPSLKQIKVWKPGVPDNHFLMAFSYHGKLLLHEENSGLLQMVNDSLELLPGSESLAHERVVLAVPFEPYADPGHNREGQAKTLLLGTQAAGFFLYDGTGMKPFPTDLDDLLKQDKVYQGIRLTSGDFAFATLRGGLVVMDPQGHLKYRFHKTSGLQDDNVKYVFEDVQGNLWLALDRGVSKIEYASPFFLYDNRSGLPGIVLSVLRHQRDLYVGTTWGLFVLGHGSDTFRPTAGIVVNCWNLLSVDNSILAATSEGVVQVKPGSRERVINDPTYVLCRSHRFPKGIWCGTIDSLVFLNGEKEQWREVMRFPSIKLPIRSIAEENNGDLWLGTLTGGAIRLQFPGNLDQPVITRCDSSQQLPLGEIYVSKAADHVIFATARGIFRFDEKTNRFIPDLTLGREFAGGKGPVFRFAEDQKKHIWFHSESRNYKAIPGLVSRHTSKDGKQSARRAIKSFDQTFTKVWPPAGPPEAIRQSLVEETPGGSVTILAKPFLRLPVSQVNTIYPDPNGTDVWFGGIDGLIRFDSTVKKNTHPVFSVFIREVTIDGTTPLFGGHGSQHNLAGSEPKIAFKDRNLNFKYAASSYENEAAVRYRYFLVGYDRDWSDWTLEPHKSYTNLNSGPYHFRVQARDVYENSTPEAVFSFRVLPPWTKTWWAFLLYGIGLLFMMALVVKWRSGKLEKEKQKLERIVINRTSEINEKNQQLEVQTLQLKEQSEKLQEMDHVKSRFFANISHEFRTPLTLIMGPLEQMLSQQQNEEQEKTINMMLRNSHRLLTLINQLLDLSRFDSGKMKLQARRQEIVSFLKSILAAFELLAAQNQLELAFNCEKETVHLYFDPPRLEQIMTNLLINAVKFTPAGGKIWISITVTGNDSDEIDGENSAGFLEISVGDTGRGIPQDQLPLIFDRFYQAEGSQQWEQDRKGTGTGIGLALTRELVTLHHGKIDVHSRSGKESGTEFIIQLPLGKAHLEPGEITETTQTTLSPLNLVNPGTAGEIPGIDSSAEAEDKSQPGPPEAEGLDTQAQDEKSVILVVEDNKDVRKYIGDSLHPHYEVVEATDGRQGINLAREIIPDLIISDIMMPGADGYRLCRELKQEIATSHIPIILLTAKASEESVIKGLTTGADDYITKPFNANILTARVQNLIDLRRQWQLKIQRQKMLLPSEVSVSSMDEVFLKEFQDMIEKNLSDPEFNVEQLSKKLYMGRSTLHKKIRALTGETPNQFIQSYRLERAAQLLKANFGNITEVAFEVGFSSTAYFTKCFKEKFHQLPSSFQAVEGHT